MPDMQSLREKKPGGSANSEKEHHRTEAPKSHKNTRKQTISGLVMDINKRT